MGVKDLNMHSAAFNMARSMYGFSVDSYPTIERAAQAAVRRIYTAGIMFRNGTIGPGGNNVMADFAALAFSKDHLRQLKTNKVGNNKVLAEIIELRQDYANNDQRSDVLVEIYNKVKALKAKGWESNGEPMKLNGLSPI